MGKVLERISIGPLLNQMVVTLQKHGMMKLKIINMEVENQLLKKLDTSHNLFGKLQKKLDLVMQVELLLQIIFLGVT